MSVILSPSQALSYTRHAVISPRNRAQPCTGKQQQCTTGNSPQTNHIKNITSFFPDAPRQSFGSARPARYPMGATSAKRSGLPSEYAHASLRSCAEIEAAPARKVLRTRMVEVG